MHNLDNENSGPKELWEVMFAAQINGSSGDDLDYFIGFSHALSLTGVISQSAWHSVQMFAESRQQVKE